MSKTTTVFATLLLIVSAPPAFAQSTVWDGLARTTIDTATSTLRAPCVVLQDGTGAAIPGFAPAFSLNLQLVEGALRLVEPLQAFEEVPESCLDSLVVDGNVATYFTESAESDSTSVENTNVFYTLELQATLPADGPIDFAVLAAEDRVYRRPTFDGESFALFAGIAPYTVDYIYENFLVDEALDLMMAGLSVYELGRLEIGCAFVDPDALLDVVGSDGDNIQYRLKSSLTAADNNKAFSINCTAFNHDINRLELDILVVGWILNLP